MASLVSIGSFPKFYSTPSRQIALNVLHKSNLIRQFIVLVHSAACELKCPHNILQPGLYTDEISYYMMSFPLYFSIFCYRLSASLTST